MSAASGSDGPDQPPPSAASESTQDAQKARGADKPGAGKQLTPQERARLAAAKRRARQGNAARESARRSVPTPLYCSIVALIIAVWAVFIFRAIQAPPPVALTAADVSAPRIRLSDGRHVAYHEMGAAADVAKHQVLVVHTWQACRLSMLPNITQSFLEANSIRLVSFDRAGYGQSDPNLSRSLQSDVRDAGEVATGAGMKGRFYLLASGLGSYVALGALRYMPERLKGVAIVSMVGSPWEPSLHKEHFTSVWQLAPLPDRISLLLARHLPALLHPWFSQTLVPLGGLRGVQASYPHPYELHDSDIAALESPAVTEYLSSNLKECLKQGPAVSWYRDLEVVAGDWGFLLSEIDLSQVKEQEGGGREEIAEGGEKGEEVAEGRVLKGRVHVWHGEEDKMAHVSLAQNLVWVVGGSKVHVVPKKGHFLLHHEADFPKTVLTTLLGIKEGAGSEE